MRTRRRVDTSGLAFLDIMSCGLGAVVLVFMLVKRNASELPVSHSAPEQAAESLREDIAELLANRQALQARLRQRASEQARAAHEAQTSRARIARLREQLAEQQASNQQAEASLQSLRQSVTETEVSAPVTLEGLGAEEYLLGLRVQGQRIAILLDSSASMVERRLVDVLTTRSGSDRDKRQGDKWRRAQRVLAWLLARVPEDASLLALSYSERAQPLGTGRWAPADPAQRQQILADAQALVPEGGTNLQAGLRALSVHKPSHLYLITDGLPTQGMSRYGSLSPFAKCSSLSGRGTTISGACRAALFSHTIQNSGIGPAVQINVILLPIEGDPEAANAYWLWAAASGGLLLSPAPSWP